jgi:NAD(P)-dependent dehydrogenase (short-subunit alcohol dehydrogenase family)
MKNSAPKGAIWEDSMLLRGKLAVVAGFGAGMPRQVAVSLAREGADLVVFGGDEAVMVSAAGEIAALGRKALCVPAAVANRAAAVALATRVEEIFGRVDVLVHNASVKVPVAPTGFESADLDAWQASFETDVFGPLVLIQSVLPLLRSSQDARVILVARRPPAGELAPAADDGARAALSALAGGLSRDLGRENIRVNVVRPGAAPRPATGDRDAVMTAGPTDEEVAGAVVFLASPLSRAVSGQTLPVDAGRWPS